MKSDSWNIFHTFAAKQFRKINEIGEFWQKNMSLSAGVCDVLIIGNSFHIWTSLDSEKRICIPRVRGEGEGGREKEREREREREILQFY